MEHQNQVVQDVQGGSGVSPGLLADEALKAEQNTAQTVEHLSKAESEVKGGRFKQTCQICSAPHRSVIEQCILNENFSARKVQQRFPFSTSTILNHAKRHMPRTPSNAVVAAPAPDTTLPSPDPEIVAKRNRWRTINQRWKALHQVMAERARHHKDSGVAGAGTGLLVRKLKSLKDGETSRVIEEWGLDPDLLREARELEKLSAQMQREIGSRDQTTTNNMQINVSLGEQAQAADVPVAHIVSRAGQERKTDDNSNYRERHWGLLEPAASQAAALPNVLEPATPSTPPYGPFAEGVPTVPPKSGILPTHNPASGPSAILDTRTHDARSSDSGYGPQDLRSPVVRGTVSGGAVPVTPQERRQVWLRCQAGHEWGSPAVGPHVEYGYCGRCGGKGEML